MLMEAESVLAWRDELDVLRERLGALFVRPEPRRQAGLYLEALLSGVQRKNGWQLAEQDRRRAALAYPAGAQPRAMGSGCRARHLPGVRDRAHRQRRWRAGGRRNELSEEGHALGWGGAAIQRHRGADRQLPDWRVPRLCQQQRPRADRPRALPA